jgi:hypothetical protein
MCQVVPPPRRNMFSTSHDVFPIGKLYGASIQPTFCTGVRAVQIEMNKMRLLQNPVQKPAEVSGKRIDNMLACRVGWFAARALGRGARHEKPRSPSIAVVFFEGRRRTADRGLRSVVARARFLRCPGLCCRLPALCCRYPAHSGPALEMSPGVVLLARSPLPLGAACSASRVVRTAVELASAVGPTALLLGSLGGCADCGL